MFERYTEHARRALFVARYETSQLGGSFIEAEHLLLGVVREPLGVLRRLLNRGGLTLDGLRQAIAERRRGDDRVSTAVEIPFSAETRRVLDAAAEEDDALAHAHIGPEHLLLGLLRASATARRDPGGRAAIASQGHHRALQVPAAGAFRGGVAAHEHGKAAAVPPCVPPARSENDREQPRVTTRGLAAPSWLRQRRRGGRYGHQHRRADWLDAGRRARVVRSGPQVRQALTNIVAVLASGGAEPRHLVRLTWCVVDRDEYVASAREIGAVYREVLGHSAIAMTAVQVVALIEPWAKVEIETTAVVPR